VNDGPKTAYVTFRSSSATTGDYALSSEDSIQFTALAEQLAVIAASSGGSVRIAALG